MMITSQLGLVSLFLTILCFTVEWGDFVLHRAFRRVDSVRGRGLSGYRDHVFIEILDNLSTTLIAKEVQRMHQLPGTKSQIPTGI